MHKFLYTKENCLYSHSIRIALEEKRIIFKNIDLIDNNDKKYDADFLKESEKFPANITIPFFKDRDDYIYDFEILMFYIDERFPNPSLMPSVAAERAKIRLALKKIHKELFRAANNIKKTDDKNIKYLLDSLKLIDPIFAENNYFTSNSFTLADCMIAAILYKIKSLKISIDNLKNITNYQNLVFKRESFTRSLQKKIKRKLSNE